jgi:GT2 family glycosyltransferase
MSYKSISVVIPTFNGKKLLEENIPFLLSSLKSERIDFEIIICDDASSDDTVTYIEKNYPEIEFYRNKTNKGFSPTINLGILKAKKDLVFILNNDVKMTDYYFEKQFKYFENPNTFGVMGRIIGTDGETQDTAKYPDYKGLKIRGSTNYEIKNVPTNFWIPTFMLSGANALIDCKKIQLLNGFDEIYAPFYWEDVDLSVRAWRLGWECYYEPNSICIHPTSSTIRELFKKKQVGVISDRNKFIFHSLHLDTSLKFNYKTKLFFKYIGCVFVFRFSFLKSFHAYLMKKNKIKASEKKLKDISLITTRLYALREIKEKIECRLNDFEIVKF